MDKRVAKVVQLLILSAVLAGCASSPPRSSPSPSPSASTVVVQPFGTLPTTPLDAASSASLQSVIDGYISQGVPDVIAAVVTPHGIWSGAAGVDGPNQRLAAPGDFFAIASISKVLTAALVMSLVDDGKMKLDSALSDYLGDPAIPTNGATVRQALQMRSGIPDTSDASLSKIDLDQEHIWTQSELIAEFPKPQSKPGTEYIYSNPTYKLLGFAVEHVTGQSLDQAMRQRILERAGSSTSLVVQSGSTATPQPWALPADGVGLGAGNALPSLSNATFSGAASGMAGTAPGVAAWAWQLFAVKVISGQSLATMLATTDSNGDGTGLDTFSAKPLSVGHTGSKEGYQSLLTIYPDKQEVIVVFVNQRDAQVAGITAKLAEVLQ